jgi:ABC-type transport system involved in cytochrome bd biosynthesis fused ATPase/permease subunit
VRRQGNASETPLDSKRDRSRATKQILGDALGVLACLLGAVMIMSSGWLLSTSKATRAEARSTAAVAVPL